MEQFRSFDEKAFQEAIRNKLDRKNLIRLKVSVISAIKADPTFSSGEIERALRWLRSDCKEVFDEKKEEIENEVELSNQDAWDEDYFLWKTIYLERNFCEERIDELRKIGQKVYGKKLPRSTEPMRQNSNQPKPTHPVQFEADKEGKQGKNPPMTAPERRYRLLIAAIAIVVILVLLTVAISNPAQ